MYEPLDLNSRVESYQPVEQPYKPDVSQVEQSPMNRLNLVDTVEMPDSPVASAEALPTIPERITQLQGSVGTLRLKVSETPWYKKIPFFRTEYKKNQADLDEAQSKLNLYREAQVSATTPDNIKFARFLIEHTTSDQRPKSIRQALESVKRGDELLKQVLDGRVTAAGKSKEEHLGNIVDMQWALQARAVAKESGFTSGTVVVEDKEGKLFDFMNASSKRYTRFISSHFKKQQLAGKMNKGIDVTNKKDGVALPYGKQHILFGALEGGTTFIKLEEHGTRGLSLLGHAVQWVKTRGKQELIGTRKEHTPKSVKADFESLGQLSPEDRKKAAIFGIRGMLNIVDAKLPDSSQSFRNSLIERGYDNLQLRKGNEVIFTKNDLVQSGSLPQLSSPDSAAGG